MYGCDDRGSVGDDMSVPNVPDLRPPLPPPAEVMPYSEEVPVAPAARRRTLTSGWRWVLACGWGTSPAIAATVIKRPTKAKTSSP